MQNWQHANVHVFYHRHCVKCRLWYIDYSGGILRCSACRATHYTGGSEIWHGGVDHHRMPKLIKVVKVLTSVKHDKQKKLHFSIPLAVCEVWALPNLAWWQRTWVGTFSHLLNSCVKMAKLMRCRCGIHSGGPNESCIGYPLLWALWKNWCSTTRLDKWSE